MFWIGWDWIGLWLGKSHVGYVNWTALSSLNQNINDGGVIDIKL